MAKDLLNIKYALDKVSFIFNSLSNIKHISKLPLSLVLVLDLHNSGSITDPFIGFKWAFAT